MSLKVQLSDEEHAINDIFYGRVKIPRGGLERDKAMFAILRAMTDKARERVGNEACAFAFDMGRELEAGRERERMAIEAFAKYGRHTIRCNVDRGGAVGQMVRPCPCGYSAALADVSALARATVKG